MKLQTAAGLHSCGSRRLGNVWQVEAFASLAELWGTLTRVFGEMQAYPALIRSYLLPFC